MKRGERGGKWGNGGEGETIHTATEAKTTPHTYAPQPITITPQLKCLCKACPSSISPGIISAELI
jgi:hypothetical protein